MDLHLNEKVALVTGSTEGIGLAIAKGLAREGAKVFLNGRTQLKIDKAISLIKKEIPQAQLSGIPADFSKVEEIDALLTRLPEVDILVNNVGIYGDRPFETTTDETWFYDFNLNVMSGVRLSRHYIPFMKAKNWGRIIFLSSESAINIPEDMILYGVTKTSYLALSRGLAKLLRGTQVTVNAILPGPTYASGTNDMFNNIAKEKGIDVKDAAHAFIEEKRPSSIIQRFASADEVANLVVYTASPLSSATTGAALRVDGGIVETAF